LTYLENILIFLKNLILNSIKSVFLKTVLNHNILIPDPVDDRQIKHFHRVRIRYPVDDGYPIGEEIKII
jgi:hypothetical protein